jgi:hypothetical protein
LDRFPTNAGEVGDNRRVWRGNAVLSSNPLDRPGAGNVYIDRSAEASICLSNLGISVRLYLLVVLMLGLRACSSKQ